MSQGRLEVSIEAMLRAVRQAHRTLPDGEFNELTHTPESAEDAAERREQIRWFTERYPTPASRLAKARKSFAQWSRSIPDEVKAEEKRLRDEEAARPVRRPVEAEINPPGAAEGPAETGPGTAGRAG